MTQPIEAVHATAVVIRDAGVMIRGPSGSGKSTLALLLIEAAERRNWFARLVGDDRILVSTCPEGIVIAPHPAIAGMIERRTQSILHLRYEPRCRLSLIVELVAPGQSLPRLPARDDETTSITGRSGIPALRLQAPPDHLACRTIFDKLAAL